MSARRVYRRSLAALIVVAPLALWTAGGEDYLAYRQQRAVVETVVAPRASAEFGGSRWQVERIETFDGAAPATPGNVIATAASLPAGTRLLRLRIALRAGDLEAVQKLNRCQLELVDHRSRRWTAIAASPARRDVATRCNGSHGDAPQIAQDFRFEQDFLLPADAAGDVDAVIRLAAESPRLLRLQLR